MSDYDIELQELYERQRQYQRIMFWKWLTHVWDTHTDFILHERHYRMGIITTMLMYQGLPFPNDSFTSLN